MDLLAFFDLDRDVHCVVSFFIASLNFGAFVSGASIHRFDGFDILFQDVCAEQAAVQQSRFAYSHASLDFVIAEEIGPLDIDRPDSVSGSGVYCVVDLNGIVERGFDLFRFHRRFKVPLLF